MLKEHESKYEPLGHDESFKIMEEILAMQIGLDTDGVSNSKKGCLSELWQVSVPFAESGR